MDINKLRVSENVVREEDAFSVLLGEKPSKGLNQGCLIIICSYVTFAIMGLYLRQYGYPRTDQGIFLVAIVSTALGFTPMFISVMRRERNGVVDRYNHISKQNCEHSLALESILALARIMKRRGMDSPEDSTELKEMFYDNWIDAHRRHDLICNDPGP